ncbi:hypothetical protein TELCIR_21171 [Teladorsagia circumcincta]|uniref:Uncharacterized protein n=1 Tax=Teladorsagia circumcincta TaxID=45464 RepID=A0A2G9TJB2_TELCI|nr:hypothetical protein TELCIR_21171 [Teladorsagia circumcincta]
MLYDQCMERKMPPYEVSLITRSLSKAVKELREGQKMGHFTRQMIYKRTEKEWKSIPKSYPIAPQRP